MNPESIDRIEHSTYTPLEKKYLKVQFVKVALVYLSLMAVSLFLLCAEGFAYRYAFTLSALSSVSPGILIVANNWAPFTKSTEYSPNRRVTGF